jgi:hypothetical protein
MSQFLTILLVVAVYFTAGFMLLGICALIVNHTYLQQSKYNNHNNNQQTITTTNKFNRAA